VHIAITGSKRVTDIVERMIDVVDDWRCAGCGKIAPKKLKTCNCITRVIYEKKSKKQDFCFDFDPGISPQDVAKIIFEEINGTKIKNDPHIFTDRSTYMCAAKAVMKLLCNV
jgi:hypothetical protein